MIPTTTTPRGLPPLDAEARRRLLSSAVLAAVLVVLAVIGTRLYGADEVLTIGGIALLALLCEGAESVDAWVLRSGRPPDAAVAGRVMRWVVVALTVYLGVVGAQDVATGASQAGGHDLAVAGALIVGASFLTLAVILAGTWRMPGARLLRRSRPISWLALAVTLQALAQNLAPATAAQGVASAVAKPVTATDLITGSLPYGVVALLAVGPAVRRDVGPWLRRLGILPLRLVGLPLGIVAGVLLLPLLNSTFGATDAGPTELVRHLGPLAVLVLLGAAVPPARRALLRAVRAPRVDADDRALIDDSRRERSPAQRFADLALLVVVVLCAVDAVGLLISVSVAHLPADCLAQQAQVGQSLSGGPTGRRWSENLGIALAAGVDEELLFRGVLQPRIGLFMSAIVFASFHLQYTCHGLPSAGNLEIVVLGVLFGLLRQRAGLPAAILAHAAYDASILLGFTL